ncbi:hypothetical protein ABT093_03600 [Kitasatospora sp. NPDC002551]|uniref:hypothetical protein n=1 Tax=Kitasatospora sp. NPDC002551 TaxID=3154539 RepID=UPI0033270166
MNQNDLWAPFKLLGDSIASEWRAHDYAEDAFGDISARLLTEGAFLSEADALELASRAAVEPEFPVQVDLDALFGQPPLTLYSTSRFHISLLYGLDATTSIHEHAFQGAFQVVCGSSLHSTWRFDERTRVCGRLRVGSATRQGSEVLTVGDVRPVLPGARGAHALFHLDEPSATLVVRTRSDPSAQPQCDYYPPSLSVASFADDASLTRRLQLLHLLRRTDEGRLREAVRTALCLDDLGSAVTVLLTACRMELGDAFTEEAAGMLADRDERLGKSLRGVAARVVRDHRLMALRRRVTAAEPRLVLALALNGLDRRSALGAFAERYRTDPVDRLAGAVGELLARTDGMEPCEPLLEILRGLLGGLPPESLVRDLGRRPEYRPRLIEKIVSALLQSPSLGQLFQ